MSQLTTLTTSFHPPPLLKNGQIRFLVQKDAQCPETFEEKDLRFLRIFFFLKNGRFRTKKFLEN